MKKHIFMILFFLACSRTEEKKTPIETPKQPVQVQDSKPTTTASMPSTTPTTPTTLPASTPTPGSAPSGRIIISSSTIEVFFVAYNINQSTLTEGSQKALKSAAESLDAINKKARIEGHASDDETNPDEISKQRADIARAYLIEHGIPAKNITAVGKGITAPKSTTDKTQNRRIEIHLLD